MAVLIFMLLLVPVLVPAAITAFHAFAGIRQRWTHSRAVHARIGYAVDPIPASA
jgi:hypothetical protein